MWLFWETGVEESMRDSRKNILKPFMLIDQNMGLKLKETLLPG